MARKTKLVDCNPRFAQMGNTGPTRYLVFDCPEGHEGCNHQIPFTPAIEGSDEASPQRNGAVWKRTGDTFETLTLRPSIRVTPTYKSREDALKDGALPEHITPSLLCAFHAHIMNGAIEFCGDSR